MIKKTGVDARQVLLESGLEEDLVKTYLEEDKVENSVKLGIKDLFFYLIFIFMLSPIYLSIRYSWFFGVDKLLIPLFLFLVAIKIRGMEGVLFLFVLSQSSMSAIVPMVMGIKDGIINIPLESVLEASIYFIVTSMICSLYSFMIAFVFFKKRADGYLIEKKEYLSRKIVEGYHRWRQTEYRSHLESINPRYSGSIYMLLDSKTSQVFYVGQTDNVKRRIKQHKRKKFKDRDFYYKIIESKIDILRVDERERFWISEYGGKGRLENETDGGSSIYKRSNSKWMKKTIAFENKHGEFYES